MENTTYGTKKNKSIMLKSAVVSILLILFDQITKFMAATGLKNKSGFVIIDGVFELKYLENQSAAFSFDPISFIHKIFHITYFDTHPQAFLNCKMAFFIVLTIIVLILIAILYQRIPWNRRFLPLNIILIGFFAGAIGNLIDRMIHHYVIDFFYFSLINFPIFNVADIYVTLSAIALILVIFFYYKEEDYAVFFLLRNQRSKNL